MTSTKIVSSVIGSRSSWSCRRPAWDNWKEWWIKNAAHRESPGYVGLSVFGSSNPPKMVPKKMRLKIKTVCPQRSPFWWGFSQQDLLKKRFCPQVRKLSLLQTQLQLLNSSNSSRLWVLSHQDSWPKGPLFHVRYDMTPVKKRLSIYRQFKFLKETDVF